MSSSPQHNNIITKGGLDQLKLAPSPQLEVANIFFRNIYDFQQLYQQRLQNRMTLGPRTTTNQKKCAEKARKFTANSEKTWETVTRQLLGAVSWLMQQINNHCHVYIEYHVQTTFLTVGARSSPQSYIENWKFCVVPTFAIPFPLFPLNSILPLILMMIIQFLSTIDNKFFSFPFYYLLVLVENGFYFVSLFSRIKARLSTVCHIIDKQ